MAVYYKWIKGCSEGGTLNSGLWSYIKWAGNSESAPSGKINDLPYLYVAKGKDDSLSEVKDLGYFLTNNAEGVKIGQDWIFNANITLDNSKLYFDGNHYIDYSTYSSGTTYQLSFTGVNGIRFHGQSGFYSPVYFEQTVQIAKDLTISNGQIHVEGKIESNNSVHAPYFNATSDMRAKENIKKLPFSALSFINNLSVYQFNYKGKEDTIPGVLAQDILNCQPEGMSLVDNIEASGENGDYMSIKEDKFIFILMRAVQELKEDNDNLRYELNQLKQKLK